MYFTIHFVLEIYVETIIFVCLKAIVTWDAPIKQLQRGCRAWQEWKYELSVTPIYDYRASNVKEEEPKAIISIRETSYLFDKSLSNFHNWTETFGFSLRATTSSGTVSLSNISN